MLCHLTDQHGDVLAHVLIRVCSRRRVDNEDEDEGEGENSNNKWQYIT